MTDPTFAVKPMIAREQRRKLIERDSLAECDRQDVKWGSDRNHPDGTGMPNDDVMSRVATRRCQKAFAEGRGAWRHIFEEEVWEAFAESDPEKLEHELIQCRAVLTQWIDNIRRNRELGAKP